MSTTRAMARPAGLTLAGMARPHLASGRGWLVALGLAMAATLALATSLPLLAASALTGGLRLALAGGVHVTLQQGGVTDFDGFSRFQQEAQRRVQGPMGPYLDGGTPFASTGPLYAVSLNGRPIAGAAASQGLTAVFVDDLEPHVEVLAGSLPPDGLGGDATAVSMPQEGADQLGLHISDRFCVDFAPGANAREGRWCARLVALWAPLDRSDPYWGGGPPRLQLTLGRYDFFRLLELRGQQGGTAQVGRRYAADLMAIDLGTAADAGARMDAVSASLDAQRALTLNENLRTALRQFDGQRRNAFATFGVAGSALVLLGLSLVSLTTRRFLAIQARDVAVLRSRGWSLGRVWRFLLIQLGAPVLVGVPMGLLAAASTMVAFGFEGAGAGGVASAVAVLATLAAMAALLALPAAGAASRRIGSPDLDASRPERPWWYRLGLDLLAGVAALPLLALPHLDLPDGALAESVGLVAPGLATATLAVAALRGLSLAAAAGGGDDVAGALARWQLRRRPHQHGGTALRTTLAVAAAVFAAMALGVGPRLAGPTTALQAGWAIGLTATVVTALAMALAGFGLHFASVAGERDREYAILAVNGLPGETLRRSLATEQGVVVAHGCVSGTILGLALALDVLPVTEVGPSIGVGAAFVSVVLTAAIVALLAVGWAARRRAGRGNLLDALRRQS